MSRREWTVKLDKGYDNPQQLILIADGPIVERHEQIKVVEASRIEKLERELMLERYRLAVCGVVARCNTRESADMHRIGSDNPYYSSSYQSACDAVDREMRLRDDLAKEKAAREIAEKMLAEIGHKLRQEAYDGGLGELPCLALADQCSAYLERLRGEVTS